MSDQDETVPPEETGVREGEGSTSVLDGVSEPASVVSPPVGVSWQEQDMLLRDLWVQNKTPQEISVILGRSPAAIMTRAARLGLPRRAAPGRKPGTKRSGSDAGVRRAVPRPSYNRTTSSGRDEAQPSPRVCLMCLRVFPSQGKHNRICPSCKNSAEYASAVSLADINLPS